MSDFTGHLYAKPSLAEGLGRTLDIGATFDCYNDSPSTEEADFMATVSDWYAVGADLLSAINAYASRVGFKKSDVARARSRS